MDLWAEAAPCLKDMLFLPGCTSEKDYVCPMDIISSSLILWIAHYLDSVHGDHHRAICQGGCVVQAVPIVGESTA